MTRGERLYPILWAIAIFVVLLCSAAAMFDMSVPDFSLHVVGPFFASHPWVPIVLIGVVVLLLFDDPLDRLFCAAWDAAAYLLRRRAKTVAANPDTRASETSGPRQN